MFVRKARLVGTGFEQHKTWLTFLNDDMDVRMASCEERDVKSNTSGHQPSFSTETGDEQIHDNPNQTPRRERTP
jgi:hypothetical protein